MTNLFSVFDPQSSLPLITNWIIVIIIRRLMPASFWRTKNQRKISTYICVSLVDKEFKSVLRPFFSPATTLLTLSLFISILIINCLGLTPFTFTPSRHLTFTVSLALPLWLGHVVWRWVYSTKNSLAHLVPLGTPIALMPFIVLIEIVRRLIRPLTLSVRLAANIVAGHLLLSLLRNQAPSSSWLLINLIIISVTLLCTLECAVAMIQSYVFRILSTLYVNEVVSYKLNN